jgi:hypothetical protein
MESKSSERATKSFYCFPIFPFADPLVGGDFTSSSKASAPFFSSPFTPPKVPNNIQLLSSSSIVASPYQPKEFSRKKYFPRNRNVFVLLSCSVEKAFKNLLHFQIAFGSRRAPQLLSSSESWRSETAESRDRMPRSASGCTLAFPCFV